jgi:hypothetical protein
LGALGIFRRPLAEQLAQSFRLWLTHLCPSNPLFTSEIHNFPFFHHHLNGRVSQLVDQMFPSWSIDNQSIAPFSNLISKLSIPVVVVSFFANVPPKSRSL